MLIQNFPQGLQQVIMTNIYRCQEILTGTDPATIIATGASGSTDSATFIQEENGVGDQEVRRSIRTRVENSRFPAGRSIFSLCFKFYLFAVCRELHYR